MGIVTYGIQHGDHGWMDRWIDGIWLGWSFGFGVWCLEFGRGGNKSRRFMTAMRNCR